MQAFFKPLIAVASRRSVIALGVALLIIAAGYVLYQKNRTELIAIGLNKAVELSGGKLSLSTPVASPLGGVSIDKVNWKDQGLEIEVTRVRIDPALTLQSLFGRQVDIDVLSADKISVNTAPSTEPFVLPESLALPVSIRLNSIAVKDLWLQNGTVHLSKLAVSAEYQRSKGRFDISRIAFTAGTEASPLSYQGRLSMDDKRPYAMQTKGDFSAKISASGAPWPVAFAIESTGSLASHQVTAKGKFRELAVDAKAELAPFAVSPSAFLSKVLLNAEGFDLAKWIPQLKALPETKVKIRFDGAPSTSLLAWDGDVVFDNALLGKVDSKRLPFSVMKGKLEFDLSPDNSLFRWNQLEAYLPDQSKPLTGALSWQPSGFKSDLVLERADASELFSGAPKTVLTGTVAVRDQNIAYDLTQGASKIRATGKAVNVKDDWLLSDGQLALPGVDQNLAWRGTVAPNKSFAMTADLKQIEANRWLEEISKLQLAELPDLKSLSNQLLELKALGGVGLLLDGKLAVEASGKQYKLSFDPAATRLGNGPLTGSVRANFIGKEIQTTSALQWRGAALDIAGALGKPSDVMNVTGSIANIAIFAPEFWAKRANKLDGSLNFTASVSGATDQPEFVIKASSKAFTYGEKSKPFLNATDSLIDIKGSAKAGLIDHEFSLSATDLGQRVVSSGRGQFNSQTQRWQGIVQDLKSEGKYAVKLLEAITVDASAELVVLGASSVLVDNGRFDLERVVYSPQAVELKGKTLNLPIEKILYWAQTKLPPTLQKLAGWSVSADVDVKGSSLETLSGRVDAAVSGEGVRPSKGQVLFNNGQLSGGFDLALESLASLSQPLGAEWRVDGELNANLLLSGRVSNPILVAQVVGNKMILEQKSLGWKMREGQIRARISNDNIAVEAMTFKVGAGSLTVTGEQKMGTSTSAGTSAESVGKFVLVANKVGLPLSPEQRIVLSGTTQVLIRPKSLLWSGKLTADEGLIELRNADAPVDPSDVVIVRDRDGKKVVGKAVDARAAATAADPSAQPFTIAADLQLDLGQKIKVIGTGVDALLQGTLNLRGTLPESPRVLGTVMIASGTYVAYGQRLQIDRGRLTFSGPFDNPSLDIVALRKNQPVEAGVSITGSALNPRLKLVSIPDVPDSEKLSWLVLGTGIENNRDNAQNAALSAAAATLLGEGGTVSASVARTLGLDVLSIRAAPTAGATAAPVTSSGFNSSIVNPNASAAQQNVVTLGKRLSSRLYVTYEQGLRGVWNLLRIQYDISNRLSLRAQTGSESAVDLLLFYPFD